MCSHPCTVVKLYVLANLKSRISAMLMPSNVEASAVDDTENVPVVFKILWVFEGVGLYIVICVLYLVFSYVENTILEELTSSSVTSVGMLGEWHVM